MDFPAVVNGFAFLQRPEWQPLGGATIWLACQPQHSSRTVCENVVVVNVSFAIHGSGKIG